VRDDQLHTWLQRLLDIVRFDPPAAMRRQLSDFCRDLYSTGYDRGYDEGFDDGAEEDAA
jgi:hypothetical protein